MLFPSTRFATPAIVQLIQNVGGKSLLVADVIDPVVEAVLGSYQMSKYQVPELDVLLDSTSEHYAYEKTFQEARLEPLLVLHTSGTTGFPKPIFYTNDWANSMAEELYLEPPEGFKSMNGLLLGSRVLGMFPRFHVRTLQQTTAPYSTLTLHRELTSSALSSFRCTKAPWQYIPSQITSPLYSPLAMPSATQKRM